MSDPQHRTPGHLIQDLLVQRGWTQRVLAIVVGVDESVINKIISGKRALEPELALALSEVFSIPAQRFMELQMSYDLAQASLIARPDPGRATRAQLFGNLPVAEMIKRGWIDASDVRNVPRVEAALTKFFGAKSVDQIEILRHAAKKTDLAAMATPAQIAWIYRVRQIASEMLVSRYSPDAVTEAIARLSPLRASPEDVRKVPRILQDCGIRFVIVETLATAKIDGVCLWLNEKAPVIGISMRFDRIDNFWFVLRHELEHVKRLHGREEYMLDVELEGERAGTGPNIPEEERQANAAAADFCVPRSSFTQFVARKAPFFARRDVLGFARTLRVHPGLVAGQIRHHTGRYNLFSDHLIKVRSVIAPSAMVDGWGEVAPTDN